MAIRVINNHRQPITLDGGTILAAAGTPGSTRDIESISDRDRRRHAGRIRIIEAVEAKPSAAPSQDVIETAPLDKPLVETEPAADPERVERPRRRISQ